MDKFCRFAKISHGELEDFDDLPDRVNEKILESIQQNWIKEID